ncbi:MAG: succinate dehydrogenase assembly factor 2 [Gammaproteobacteria bacterium]
MTAVLENALRWQSRRGVLELDLVLDKFWRQAGTPSESELHALGELLALDDEELRREINGETGQHRTPAARQMSRLLQKL